MVAPSGSGEDRFRICRQYRCNVLSGERQRLRSNRDDVDGLVQLVQHMRLVISDAASSNEQLPLDLVFTDEQGKSVKLGDYFGKKPVVLSLVYYQCPMLCNQVMNGMVTAFKVMNFQPGQEFEVVTVSFDPREIPALE